MEQYTKFFYQIRVNRLRDHEENFENLRSMVQWLKENIGKGYWDGPDREWDIDINGSNKFYYTFYFLKESYITVKYSENNGIRICSVKWQFNTSTGN